MESYSLYENFDKSYLQLNEYFKHDVKIFIEFIKIGEIDVINESYEAEINVECRWITNEEIKNYDPTIHWNPSLYVENLLTEIKQTIYYKIEPEKSENKIITQYMKIKGV